MKKLVRLTESDLHRVIKESVKRVLREMDGDGYDPFEEGNAIICSVSAKQLTYGNRAQAGANLYGNGIYMSVGDKIPSHYMNGDDIIQVYVDASNFAHPSNPKEAMEIGKSGQVPGMIFNTRHDGEVCIVFDTSCILSRV